PPSGRARALAVHESFGSIVAHVAEVSVDGGTIRVHRVVAAIDCGVCVTPLGVRAQMDSGIAFGLSAALHGKLTMKEGRVQESTSHDDGVLRMHEMPQVETYIVDSREKPGGAGEPGTPPIAPAVANAVFALTGQRLRDLPPRLEISGGTPCRRPKWPRRPPPPPSPWAPRAARAPAPRRPLTRAWRPSPPYRPSSSIRAARTATSPATHRCSSTPASPTPRTSCAGRPVSGSPACAARPATRTPTRRRATVRTPR